MAEPRDEDQIEKDSWRRALEPYRANSAYFQQFKGISGLGATNLQDAIAEATPFQGYGTAVNDLWKVTSGITDTVFSDSAISFDDARNNGSGDVGRILHIAWEDAISDSPSPFFSVSEGFYRFDLPDFPFTSAEIESVDLELHGIQVEAAATIEAYQHNFSVDSDGHPTTTEFVNGDDFATETLVGSVSWSGTGTSLTISWDSAQFTLFDTAGNLDVVIINQSTRTGTIADDSTWDGLGATSAHLHITFSKVEGLTVVSVDEEQLDHDSIGGGRSHVGDNLTPQTLNVYAGPYGGNQGPEQFGTSQDNWQIGDDRSVLMLEATASSLYIGGIEATLNGQMLVLINTGTNDFQVLDNAGSSAAPARFRLPNGDMTLTENASVILWYDNTQWRQWNDTAISSHSHPGIGGAFPFFIA